MKSCATCQRTFPLATAFCPDDGTALQPVAAPVQDDDAADHAPPPLPVKPPTQPTSSAVAAEPPPEAPEEGQDSNIGKLVGDRYLILSLIGLGGMGAVYRAEQVHLRKVMAIKLLHENLSARKQLISRFTREARAISRLSSPHTVMVYDFGRWNDLFFLVMEILEGESLDAVLERDGPLPAERVAHIVLQMCESLAEAHSAGIIHRDLKPENVMLVRNPAHADFVKILDFGLAKVSGVDDPYTIHSQRDIFGTPFYMSPEQIRAGEIDHRSDVYAVGALMFRMLTGRYAFGGDLNTFDTLKAHLMEPLPAMAVAAPGTNVPAAMERIVRRALEKEPAKRYQSMGELATDLRALALQPVTASAAPVPTQTVGPAATPAPTRPPRHHDSFDAREEEEALGRGARRQQRQRHTVFIVGLCVLAVAILGAMALSSNGAHGDEREPNDTPQQANVLGPDGTARGVIGRRRSPEAGDRDCFRLPALKSSEELTIRLEGVPTMDLGVALLRADGEQRMALSHRGVGQGEVLRYLDLRTPLQTICVSEHKEPTAVASESLSDQYTLKVEVGPRAANAEREPNDVGNGNDLRTGAELVGSLDGLGDVDNFALDGQFDQRLLKIELTLQAAQALGDVRMALYDATGRLLALAQPRAGEVHGTLTFVADGDQVPDRLEVRRLRALPQTAGGLGEVPYTLRYQLQDLVEQVEVEPNDDEGGATRLVAGAWLTGTAEDAAAVDWLAIEGGDPTLSHLRIEAIAPPGNAFALVVRDTGKQVDVREVQVTDAANQDLHVTGSGEGFLLRIKPLAAPPPKHGRQVMGAHYRIRVRYERGAPQPLH